MTHRLAVAAVLLLTACAPEGDSEAVDTALAALAAIDATALLQNTRTLSSDEFQGRAPGTAGEDRELVVVTDWLSEVRAAPTDLHAAPPQPFPSISSSV